MGLSQVASPLHPHVRETVREQLGTIVLHWTAWPAVYGESGVPGELRARRKP